MLGPILPLLLLHAAVLAAEPVETTPATEVPLAEAPVAAQAATVLEHHEKITIDAGRRLYRQVRFTLRVDDPERCAAGLIVPRGLSGASDRGAVVLEDTLVLPPEVARGDVFTLQARHREPPGGHSDGFRTAPDLAVDSAVFEINAPGSLPLHVWFDANAHPSWRGGRSVRVEWKDLAPGTSAEAVWSTWRNWIDAGRAVESRVSRLMADKHALGRALAADLNGLDVRSVVERVQRDVALEPGEPGHWFTARPAAEVVRSGRGSAADRGVVLLNLLRLAGHDAVPGSFRPAADGVDFPVTVPAPGMLPRPVVIVNGADGPRFIDPASEFAAPSDVPAALAGGMVWQPGDVPTHLRLPTLLDGTVLVNASLQIASDGSASWTASISADGIGNERLRELVAPLDEAGRADALARLVRVARPGIERFTVKTSGVESAGGRLRLNLSGHDTAALDPIAHGMTGSIRPLLAPALAAWLPPNIRVLETLAITPPHHLQVLGTHAPTSAATDEALVSVRHTREGQRQILTVEAERPYRRTSPARDSAAQRFLHTQADHGLELLLVGSADPAGARVIRRSEMPEHDRALLEALLWWSVEDDRRATKALKRAPDLPMDRLLETVERWVPPSKTRPFTSLTALATWRGDDRALQRIAEARTRRSAPTAGATDTSGSDEHPDVALRRAMTDARLAVDDPALWRRTAEFALRAGEASAAHHAARRASDLRPEDPELGRLLVLTSAILVQRDDWDLGRRRAGEQGRVVDWPLAVDDLVSAAPEAMYAILVHRDDQVSADPRLLAIRAQQHIDAGRLDDAARDGVLLAERHGKPEGQAMAFAATAGRLYSTAAVAALDRAAAVDPTARLTRLEYRLVSGVGDATADARALDDPRAEVVARLRSDPKSVVAEVEGWPLDAVDERLPAPSGYRVHRLLDALPGLHAWSDPDGATAILRWTGAADRLPPPLAQLYTATDQSQALSDGRQLRRLDGGVMPLFAVVESRDDAVFLGIGFTPEAAVRASDAARTLH